MAKRVLVVCGTGVATSTVVAIKIREHCAAAGINIDVVQGKVMDIVRGVEGYDLIVSTTPVPSSVTIPSINGLPYLTGMGLDDTLNEIVLALQG